MGLGVWGFGFRDAEKDGAIIGLLPRAAARVAFRVTTRVTVRIAVRGVSVVESSCYSGFGAWDFSCQDGLGFGRCLGFCVEARRKAWSSSLMVLNIRGLRKQTMELILSHHPSG